MATICPPGAAGLTPAGDRSQYYEAGGKKTIADHFQLMLDNRALDPHHEGLQVLSVDFRGEGDMTIWATGRLSDYSYHPTIKMEWADFFAVEEPALDAGVADSGVAPGDAALPGNDSTQIDASSSVPKEDEEGCSCQHGPGSVASTSVAGLCFALFLLRGMMRRRRLTARGGSCHEGL